MKSFIVTDVRRKDVFPNLNYRFARLEESEDKVILERDFLGENPEHYYVDGKNNELTVGSNIADIREYLQNGNRNFAWDRVRAVSNNTRGIIDNSTFKTSIPLEQELGDTLQEQPLDATVDYSNFASIGKRVRTLLEDSLTQRLDSVQDQRVGLLLSGGLDSMSIGYLISRIPPLTTAFTLKASDTDKDILKSREMAQRCGLDLVEIGILPMGDSVRISNQHYDSNRNLIGQRTISETSLDRIVNESLTISGNPKKDNLLCAVAMYLAGSAIKEEGISTVFCGEGPNEMINDYGYNPQQLGYGTSDKGDSAFREALTFGLKKSDKQLGRGGLPKHAIVRMGKIFAHYGLRLEAPYFDRRIAKILTHVPHNPSYDTVKQHLMLEILCDNGFNDLIEGTSKEKFQDGSGISGIFEDYDQRKLVDMFEKTYGIRKTAYL